MNAPLVTLDGVTDLLTDGTHYTPKDLGEGFPFLTVKDLSENGLDFINCSRIAENEFKNAKKQNSAPQKGDILFSKDGTVGKVHLVREDQPFAVLSSLAILRPSAKIDGAYLAHFLRTPSTIEAAGNKKTGSAIRRIVLRDLATLEIPLPPLDEQRRIAAILDKADAIYRKSKRALHLLDSLTQSIFLKMFGDLVSSPKKWGATQPLGNFARIVSGITKGRRLNGEAVREVPYLAVSNVQDKFLDMKVVKTIEASENEIKRYRLEKNDLLLTEGGDPDKLGRGTLWANELDESIHQNHIFRVRVSSNEVLPFYLIWLLGSPYGKAYFLRSAKQTTGIASINKRQLSDFPVILPPIGLQVEFEERVHCVERVMETKKAASKAIDCLFSSLQSRAFAGQL
jgi:type I restriction enzyme S subunit